MTEPLYRRFCDGVSPSRDPNAPYRPGRILEGEELAVSVAEAREALAAEFAAMERQELELRLTSIERRITKLEGSS